MRPLAALLLALVPGARALASAEYHWTLCEKNPATLAQKLGAVVSGPKARVVYYFDAADRRYYRAGLVLRVRGKRGEALESTVKIRVDPGHLPSGADKCETDFLGSARKTYCSLDGSLDPGDLHRFLNGKLGAEKLFSDRQRRFLERNAKSPDWNSLRAVGPVDAREWKLKGQRKLEMERHELPSGEDIWELSTKTGSPSPWDFQKLTRSWLTRGVRLCSRQIGKTAWVLGVK